MEAKRTFKKYRQKLAETDPDQHTQKREERNKKDQEWQKEQKEPQSRRT